MNLRPIPCVSSHARERAIERLGGDPPRADWLAAVASIIERRAVLLCAQTVRDRPCDVYLVTLAGQAVQVLWRPDVPIIVTLITAGGGARAFRQPPRKKRGHIGANDKWRNRPEREPYRRERPRVGDWQ